MPIKMKDITRTILALGVVANFLITFLNSHNTRALFTTSRDITYPEGLLAGQLAYETDGTYANPYPYTPFRPDIFTLSFLPLMAMPMVHILGTMVPVLGVKPTTKSVLIAIASMVCLDLLLQQFNMFNMPATAGRNFGLMQGYHDGYTHLLLRDEPETDLKKFLSELTLAHFPGIPSGANLYLAQLKKILASVKPPLSEEATSLSFLPSPSISAYLTVKYGFALLYLGTQYLEDQLEKAEARALEVAEKPLRDYLAAHYALTAEQQRLYDRHNEKVEYSFHPTFFSADIEPPMGLPIKIKFNYKERGVGADAVVRTAEINIDDTLLRPYWRNVRNQIRSATTGAWFVVPYLNIALVRNSRYEITGLEIGLNRELQEALMDHLASFEPATPAPEKPSDADGLRRRHPQNRGAFAETTAAALPPTATHEPAA